VGVEVTKEQPRPRGIRQQQPGHRFPSSVIFGQSLLAAATLAVLLTAIG
jgi:hypothetical protein